MSLGLASSSIADAACSPQTRPPRIASVAAAPLRVPADNEVTVIACQGEQLHLLPQQAVHWPVRRTVFVADLHLGKEHAFGRQGIPIPAGSSEATLARLDTLLRITHAERLVVLGDLMHAAPEADESWLGSLSTFLDEHRELDVRVCAGNHDREAGRTRIDARVRWHAEPIVDGPFVLQHHPGEDARGYVLCGHVHPTFMLGRSRRDALRVPAFWFRPGQAVLPAFGGFTGGHAIRAERGDRIWISGPERVVAVSQRRR